MPKPQGPLGTRLYAYRAQTGGDAVVAPVALLDVCARLVEARGVIRARQSAYLAPRAPLDIDPHEPEIVLGNGIGGAEAQANGSCSGCTTIET